MNSKLGINPWLSILTKPRETIKAIIEFNSNYRLLILSMIYGFSAILGATQNLKLGNKFDFIAIIISVVILAPLWGYLSFSISSFFIYFTGKLIRGKGKYKDIRAVAAWSSVPFIVSSLLWIVLLFIFGAGVFNNFANKELLSTGFIFILFAIMFVQLIASIWSLIIYINALAEAQNFSILRAILNIILSAIAVGILVIIIGCISKWTCSSFFDSPVLVMLF